MKGPSTPWAEPGSAPRFANHVVAFGGKLAKLRKDEVVAVLKAEGAVVATKLDKKTTLFVFVNAGSADHQRALKMQQGGQALLVASEDEFRLRYLLPTADQADAMLREEKGRARLAALLELNRAKYSRSVDAYSTIVLDARSFHGAELGGSTLCGIHFVGCDLGGAVLTKVPWLAGATRSDFRGANAAELELVDSSDCDFQGAKLAQASFRDLEGCRFEDAVLTKAHGSDVTKCRFDRATLDDTNLRGTIRDCSFDKATFTGGKIGGAEVEGCSFVSASFRNATIQGTSSPLLFADCNFEQADFRGATLSHVRFERCKLAGACFDDATVIGLELVDTDATAAKGLDTSAPTRGPARQALETATPTFKNIEVGVVLRAGAKTLECKLYQFDHAANSSCRQAWLDGEDLGSLPIAEAISTIAKLRPDAKLEEASLAVKSSKGKVAPALTPKQLEKAVLEAWREALA